MQANAWGMDGHAEAGGAEDDCGGVVEAKYRLLSYLGGFPAPACVMAGELFAVAPASPGPSRRGCCGR